MMSTLQPKLRGISMADDLPEKLTITFDDILNQIVSTVNNFFEYLIGLFNKEFPPDTPRHWFDVAAPYLLAAAALITCLCVCHCLFSCISFILIRCFDAVCSCFPCLGRCLCCGGRSEERMMIAPGRSPLMLPRAAFEANPRGFLGKVWWIPISIQKMMKSQGIEGLPYAFPHGNTRVITAMRNRSMSQPMDMAHNIFSRIQPHVDSWIKIYGMNFINWHGSQAQLFVTEPELVKEILNNREGAYPKMDMEGYAKKLLGEALITNEGEKWAKVRKLANHTFHAESLKNMIPEMSRSVETMLERWKDYEGQEIDVHKEFGVLTTEVISRTAFGSSYVEGKHIFEMVAKLTAITVRNIYKLRFPGISSILKTDDEIEAEKLEQAIKKSILDIVKKRKMNMGEGVDEFGSDYLGQLVKIAKDSSESKRITVEQMIDEIKAIYGAGHLTTTNLLSWTVFLLAINQDWQDKVREEVLEFFGRKTPTSDGIARLKTMNMVINESLRLYPPVLTMTRKVEREIKLGNLTLPAKLNIFISILALHHNPEIWGNDVHCFRPERFANGVARATKNNAAAFLPFGMGPRTCVGLNFTTNEAKIALSMILQRYRFTLSSNYVHYPADVFILTPKKGVQVILHNV